MKEYSKIAVQNFKNGYNCAQSVCLAFVDKLNLDEKTILKLSSSFGGGMGRLREVCGAVSAMFIIAGILKGYDASNDDAMKANHYKLIQDLAQKFKNKHSTIICRELLGLDENDESISYIPSKRTEEYYAQRPCENFIQLAAEIIEKELL